MPRQYAECMYCHTDVPLRQTGSKDVVGTFWKHQRPDDEGMAQWCLGGGELPLPADVAASAKQGRLPSEQPLAECVVCHRRIKRMKNGWLYKHWVDGMLCDGGGTDPGQDGLDNGWGQFAVDNDNISHGGSAMTFGVFQPEPLTITVAHPGGGQAGLELAEWWANTAISEINMVVAKAIEYGATDLRDLGYQILEMAGRRPIERDAYDDAVATEVGIAFYAQGKLARIVAAVKEGRRPSVDSWLDLGVYARMGQRVHQVGGWPNGPA